MPRCYGHKTKMVYYISNTCEGRYTRHQVTQFRSVFRNARSYCSLFKMLPDISDHTAPQHGSVVRILPPTTTQFGSKCRPVFPLTATQFLSHHRVGNTCSGLAMPSVPTSCAYGRPCRPTFAILLSRLTQCHSGRWRFFVIDNSVEPCMNDIRYYVRHPRSTMETARVSTGWGRGGRGRCWC